MRTAVDELSEADWERPSGCTGWLVRDLVCHLIIDAQGVLITLVTPADTEPTADSTTYWTVTTTPPTGDDPPFPASFSDTDALLVGTGRRAPTATETAALGDFPAKLPLVIG